MAVWIVGQQRLVRKTRREEVSLQFLADSLAERKLILVPGTAIFLTSDLEGAPTALLHSLKHYKVLHEHNVVLTVVTTDTPRVPEAERVSISSLNALFSRVVVRYGFVEAPNIPKTLMLARKLGWKYDIMSTSFFLSRRSLKPSQRRGLPAVIDHAADATEHFQIPTGRVVEIGTQIVL